MKIAHIASELSPMAKVGGLADVVYGLASATKEAGHDVSIVIPAYPGLKKEFFSDPPISKHTIDPDISFAVFKKKFNNLTIFGIDLVSPSFQRESIYGGKDEVLFFFYFSKTASHVCCELNLDIVHGHDWQAAFALFELRRLKSITKTVLTLHNMQYQGKMKLELLAHAGLSLPIPAWMHDPFDSRLANLLKIGIESADRITTVSKSYHDEICDGYNGFGLEKTLMIHRNKFLGIINGIDDTYFDPFHDEKLEHKYPRKALSNADALKKVKSQNLKSLLQEHEKPFDERFTVCSITRLADQKAPFLILYALKKTVEMGGRFILVGSLHGSPHDDQIINFLKDYEDHPHVIVELNTNSQMAHMTYAASHALVIPSIFEPCGLTQLIAFKFGTLPLVRSTGGLKDTVFDMETSIEPIEKRNGLTFDYPDQGGIDWVIDRAFKMYNENPEEFYSLCVKNMHEDHSWKKASESYLEIYKILTLNHQVGIV